MPTLNENNTTLQDWRIESTTSHLGIPQAGSRLATLRYFSSVLEDLHEYLHSIHELFHLEYTFRLGRILYDLTCHSSVEMASAAFSG